MVLPGPARISVDALFLSHAFSFEPPSNCACIFHFKVRLLLEAMQKPASGRHISNFRGSLCVSAQ